MFKKLLLSLIVISSMSVSAQQVRYTFTDKDGIHEVQPCFVDSILRQVPANKIHLANKVLAIRAIKMDNGEYCLRAHVRGEGGLVLGYAAGYWGTKITLNGAYIVACWFDPVLIVDFAHVQAGIEIASNAVGTATAVTTPV